MVKAQKQGTIPQHELKALAEVLYPTLKKYLSSSQGKAEFQAWKDERKKEKTSKK